MSDEVSSIAIEIMGRSYQIKCPATEIASLKQSVQYLEDKLQEVRDAGVLNADRVIVIAALNIVNQLLRLERQNEHFYKTFGHRLLELQHKMEHTLAKTVQLEFETAE